MINSSIQQSNISIDNFTSLTFNNFLNNSKNLSPINKVPTISSQTKQADNKNDQKINWKLRITACCLFTVSSHKKNLFLTYGYEFMRKRFDKSAYNKLYNEFLFLKYILLTKKQRTILTSLRKISLDNTDIVKDVYEININSIANNSVKDIVSYFIDKPKDKQSKIDESLFSILPLSMKQNLIKTNSSL